MADIVFTVEKFRRFKQAYEEAKQAGQEQFCFEGNQILVAYAKYMIEYLQGHK